MSSTLDSLKTELNFWCPCLSQEISELILNSSWWSKSSTRCRAFGSVMWKLPFHTTLDVRLVSSRDTLYRRYNSSPRECWQTFPQSHLFGTVTIGTAAVLLLKLPMSCLLASTILQWSSTLTSGLARLDKSVKLCFDFDYPDVVKLHMEQREEAKRNRPSLLSREVILVNSTNVKICCWRKSSIDAVKEHAHTMILKEWVWCPCLISRWWKNQNLLDF